MTLIISGYNHSPGFTTHYEMISGIPRQIKTATAKSQRDSGLFSIADSVITTIGTAGKVPLLKGFKKIVNIPIKLWQPYFVAGAFKNYNSTFIECECFVAFAGSTLTSQHVINLISNHLSELRIDYKKNGKGYNYVVVMNCEENTLASTSKYTMYDDDLFIPERDYTKILTADVIVNIVEHSINKALNSAKEFRLSEQAFQEMYTEFTLGINCPVTNKDVIYQFEMDKKMNENGVYDVFVNKKLIAEDQVSIIGMKREFEETINNAVSQAINSNLNLRDELKKCMEQAINVVDSRGSFEIGRPIIVKCLKNQKLYKISVD